VRRTLRAHLDAFDGPRLLVTHDPVDAMALADRVVVLETGRIVQRGTVAELRARPRTRYVADLIGVNLYQGRADGDRVALRDGGELRVTNDDQVGGDVFAVVRPGTVAIYRDRPAGSPRNTWAGTIGAIDHGVGLVRVRLDAEIPVTAEITPAALRDLHLEVGERAWASVKATEVELFPT
jgi:molybdate transport system ATP-binding protein